MPPLVRPYEVPFENRGNCTSGNRTNRGPPVHTPQDFLGMTLTATLDPEMLVMTSSTNRSSFLVEIHHEK